jgi:hypothetical protein
MILFFSSRGTPSSKSILSKSISIFSPIYFFFPFLFPFTFSLTAITEAFGIYFTDCLLSFSKKSLIIFIFSTLTCLGAVIGLPSSSDSTSAVKISLYFWAIVDL